MPTDLDDPERMLPPESEVPIQEHPESCAVGETTSLLDEICEAQLQDPHCVSISLKIFQLIKLDHRTPEEDEFLATHGIVEDLVWQRTDTTAAWKVHVPTSAVPRVLYEFHDAPYAGHPGIEETLRAIRKYHCWPRMYTDIKQCVRECLLCATCKRAITTTGPLRPHQPTQPWEVVSVDLMGPYPRTARGRRFILVVTDMFTRWVEAFPIGSSKAPRLTRLIEDEVIGRSGYPRAILSDNGPQFRSQHWEDACSRWDTEHWTTPTYHPQANPTERRNQEIKKGLRLHLQGRPHRDWDNQLPRVLAQIRNRKNAATGATPSMLLLGYDSFQPGEWRTRQAVSRLSTPEQHQAIRNQQEYQRRYNDNQAPPPALPIGTPVLIRNHQQSNAQEQFHAGFAPKWNGPYRIHAQLGGDVYMVDTGESLSKIHRNQIQRAHNPRLETIPEHGEQNEEGPTIEQAPDESNMEPESVVPASDPTQERPLMGDEPSLATQTEVQDGTPADQLTPQLILGNAPTTDAALPGPRGRGRPPGPRRPDPAPTRVYALRSQDAKK